MERLFKDKVVAIQATLKAPKSQMNNFGGYRYRSCEDIMEAVKPLLKDTGLILTVSDDIIIVGDRVYVKAIATLTDGTDSISTTAYAREPRDKKGQDDSQITGSASSYARKYALNGLFCIDDTKDSDATNTHGKEEPSSVRNGGNPLAPGTKVKDKPLVQEGNELWTKALSFCRRNQCPAETLRKWYTISDTDANTMNNILSFSEEINS